MTTQAGSLRYAYEPLAFEGAELADVADVAVDSEGRIHAMVRGEYPLLVFNQRGRLLRKGGKNLFGNPHGLHIDARDRVYAVDGARHVVHRMRAGDSVEFTLGKPGEASASGAEKGNFKTVLRGAGPFHCPTKVATSPSGEIFVSDGYGNARVHRFGPDGAHILSWGEPGTEPGQFMLPHGIALDAEGLVYVADRENERIQVFEQDGTWRATWPDICRPTAICVWNDLVYVAELGRRMYVDNVLFKPDGNGPWSRVRIFDREGTELCAIGGPDPCEPGSLYAAHSICVDAEGSIYVGEVRWPDNESPRPQGLRPSLHKFRRLTD